METRRDRYLKRLRPAPSAKSRGARERGWGPASSENVTLRDVVREYFFLRIGDLISLTFCNGWTEGQLDDSGSGYAMSLDGTRLTITPDPFEGREVPLEVTARELPNRPFHSAAEARSAFSIAEKVPVEGVASGPISSSSAVDSILGRT
jgi:hypothetical protein